MKAEEIRDAYHALLKESAESGKTEHLSIGTSVAQSLMLTEIAAQLATLNEWLYDLNYLRVQVEPGQYPIVTESRK